MWAESEAGKGSHFHFTIRAEAASAPELVVGTREHVALTGKRLLIVDDHKANREVVRRQAISWGMLPRETESASEALEWIRRGDPFDAVILDMQMPDMNGVELAQEIRRLRDERILPLVMSTSLGRRVEDSDAGVHAAAQLTKPIKASQLYEALLKVFGDVSGQTTPVEAGAEQGTVAADGTSLRILVADDNAMNQKLALALLSKLGYGADVVTNGAAVLDALARQHYDVVLMDVEMPVMDGLEASRRINREWPAGRRPRIVAMTANAMQGDREEASPPGWTITSASRYAEKSLPLRSRASSLARFRPTLRRSRMKEGEGSGRLDGARGFGRRPGSRPRFDFSLPRRCARAHRKAAEWARAGRARRGAPGGAHAEVERSNVRRDFAGGPQRAARAQGQVAIDGRRGRFGGRDRTRIHASGSRTRSRSHVTAATQAYVLVVDDDSVNRLLLARSLEREGHRVATAEDGQKALENLRAESFDVVLLDVLMPKMDGFEVLAQMQADNDLRRIPVIMISALEDIESVVRGIELGADDYLPKPFNPVLLRARINAGLMKKRLNDLERGRVRGIFSRFVPEHVVDEVLRRTDDDLRLGGVRVEGTVMFSDLREFTAFAELRRRTR